MSAAHPLRARIARFARYAVALLLLAFVAWSVPWRDVLVLDATGAKLTAKGTIDGPWRAGSIAFVFDAASDLDDARWPEAARAARASGARFEVARDGAEHWDWRPGLLRVFHELEPRGLATALAMLVLSALVAITRWWRLLRVAGCATRWWDALRLTFVGFFSNLVLPGLTGGDLVKAVLVVRENPERRADALVSVVVDRGIGLVVLIGIATVVALSSGSAFAQIRVPIVLTFAGVLFGLWCVLHPLPRRVLRVEAILDRLPQRERLRSVDRALRIYNGRPAEMSIAVVLSVLNHMSLAYALYALSRAFHSDLSYVEVLGIASVANTVSSIPIAPGGWGVGEAAFGSLYHMLGSPAALGIAVSVTYRLLNTALGLSGGLFLLLPGGREVRAELAAEHADPEAPARS